MITTGGVLFPPPSGGSPPATGAAPTVGVGVRFGEGAIDGGSVTGVMVTGGAMTGGGMTGGVTGGIGCSNWASAGPATSKAAAARTARRANGGIGGAFSGETADS